MLRELKRDGLSEVAYAAVGAAIGSIPNTIGALWAAYSPEQDLPLTIGGLGNLAVSVLSVSIAFVCFLVVKNRGSKMHSLIEDIKNGR